MSILIEDPEILAIINTQMALGHYKNPDEVIRSALSAMEKEQHPHYGPFDGPWTEEKLKAALEEALLAVETGPLYTSEEVFAPLLAKYSPGNV